MRKQERGLIRNFLLGVVLLFLVPSIYASEILHWPGNGNANDISGNNYHASPAYISYEPGVDGECFGFNGVTGGSASRLYRNMPSLSTFTLSFWINSNDQNGGDGSYKRLFSTQGDGYEIAIRGNHIYLYSRIPNGAWVYLGTTNLSEWNHVAITHTNSSIQCYVNGNLVTTVANRYFQVSGNILMGRRYSPGPYYEGFRGLLDEIKFYSNVWTPEEIMQEYGNYAPVANAGADPVFNCVIGNTDVPLDASGSTDPDGDPMTYSWTGSFGTVTGINPTINLGVGTHPITLTATDSYGISATDDMTVTVNADNEAPEITLLGDNPNHLFFRTDYVEAGYNVSDNCDAGVTVEVTGTVNTESPGTYILTYSSTDESGNIGTAQRMVTVNSLLTNGGFEGSGAGWSRSGNVWIHGSVVHYNEHDRSANGSINQYVSTVIGQQYRLEFDYAAHGNTAPGSMRVRVHVGPTPVLLDQTLTAGPASWEWRHASYTFTAQTTSTRIWFGDSSGRTYQVDMHLNNATLVLYNPPIADAGSDLTELVAPGGMANITLDASGSGNPDGNDLTYTWAGFFGSISDISPLIQLPAGEHLITLSIDDGIGATVTDDILIAVAEVELPINGLVGYWPGDGNAEDITGNADGSPGSTTAFEGGLKGEAFSFDAAQSSNVNLPVNINQSLLPQMTMGMFIKLKTVVNTRGWVIGHDNGGYDRSLILHDYRYGYGLAAGVGHTYGSALPQLRHDIDQWSFIAVSYDQASNTATIYLNDLDGQSLVQTVNTSNDAGNPTTTLGGLGFGGHGVHGLVDEVFIYDRTMTQEELDQVCDDLNPNTAPVASAGFDQDFDCVISAVNVTLDGSGSSDPDGNALTYSWSLAGTVLSTEMLFTSAMEARNYTYTLTVHDGTCSRTDNVDVTILADSEPPTLTLLGDNPMSLNIHIPYEDAGFETVDACGSEVTVEISGSVDVETPGPYTLTYTATDAGGNVSTAERIVTVINAVPVAMAGDDQSIDCVVESAIVELDGSLSSDADGDALSYLWTLGEAEVSTLATFDVSIVPGEYTYTLTVSDDFDSSSDEVLVSIVADTVPPTLTLLGDNPMSLGLYLEYLEAGYEAVDLCGSEVTVEITGDVDVNTPGSYTLTYTATDEGGNASSANRVIEVFNTAPEVVDAVEGIELSFGDDLLTAEIDLVTVFADIDINDVLTFGHSNSNGAAATASLSGSLLTLDALDLGETTVEITATDDWSASASQSFIVLVNVTSDLAGALLFAESKIELKKDIEIFSGNVLINDIHEHEQEDNDHHEHDELKIDKDTYIAPGYKVMADGIKIKKDALIESDVYANELDNKGDITGDIYDAADTPLFTTMPPFKSAPAGDDDITVRKNQDLVLEPGDYHHIKVEDRGTLTFTGGVYNIAKLEAKKESHIRFELTSEVRVEKELKFKKDVYVGPAGDSYIDASDIIFYVDDDNENDDHGHPHHSAKLEEGVVFYGTIYSNHGKVELKKEVSFTGSILAVEIKIYKESDLALDSYFGGTDAGLAKGVAWVEPEMRAELPLASDLSGNYPNPFNPSTTIDFVLDKAGDISLKIYDIRGAEVEEIAHGYYEAGRYSVHFQPVGLSSGTYLYVLDTGSFREVKKMIYLK